MKFINLIENVQSWLASDAASDAKGQYHPEEIRVWLVTAFGRMMYNAWLNGKKYSDFSQLDAWSKTYELTIAGQSGAKAYALLPFAPMQLPDNMGVRQICDHDDTTNVFVPTEATSNVVFAELEVNTFDTTPTYNVEQSNINVGAGEASHLLRLDKLPVPASIATLDALLIRPLDTLDDFDDIAVPENGEDDLMRAVIDVMSKKPKADTSNDMVNEKQ